MRFSGSSRARQGHRQAVDLLTDDRADREYRWAAYNAVTEYLDRVVAVRGARTASDGRAARALRGITASGSSQSPKAQAFPMLPTW
jgi:hypothetical protein